MSEHGYTKLNSYFFIFNTAAPSGIFVEYALVTNWNLLNKYNLTGVKKLIREKKIHGCA